MKTDFSLSFSDHFNQNPRLPGTIIADEQSRINERKKFNSIIILSSAKLILLHNALGNIVLIWMFFQNSNVSNRANAPWSNAAQTNSKQSLVLSVDEASIAMFAAKKTNTSIMPEKTIKLAMAHVRLIAKGKRQVL